MQRIRFNERGHAVRVKSGQRDARRELTALEFAIQKRREVNQRKSKDLTTHVEQTLLDVSPLGAAFNETRERDQRHHAQDDSPRFIPYPSRYDEQSDTWVRPRNEYWDERDKVWRERIELQKEPRYESARLCLAQNPNHPLWRVTTKGNLQLWTFHARNWHEAMGEAQALARTSGYNPKALRVRKCSKS